MDNLTPPIVPHDAIISNALRSSKYHHSSALTPPAGLDKIPHMASREDLSGNLVESMEIPLSLKELYNRACRDDRFLAESLAIPGDRLSTTILVHGQGLELIKKIEDFSLTRTKRGLEQHGIKPAVQVYFPGVNILGQPYMVIIPFFISGSVMLEQFPIQLGRYYHVYGNCRLRVETERGEEGKLGVWAYMLGT
ncbi:hypothetical protein N7513_007269 [Penicillium frequentans]|nr:hypothetical protein N7513_007269 [Penicillium glabrum]